MTCFHDYQYLALLNEILTTGTKKLDRTGVGTIGVFGRMLDFDVSTRVPILTTKSIHLKSVIHELLWFISGETNIQYLKDNGVTIWDEWADENGDLGPVYGKQWRDWNGHDQLATVIDEIKRNPNSRRLLVSAWNPPLVWSGEMALPPCHYSFQLNIEGDDMSLLWNQRSVDTFLGLPFNIASYTILLYMIAQVTGYRPKRVIASLGDTHIYLNHIDQVKEQLIRTVKPSPTLVLSDDVKKIDDFYFEDVRVFDYDPHPAIKAPIAV